MRLPYAAGAALAVFAVAACAGPNAPFDVGTQSAPVGITLGEHDAVVTAPVGPVSVPLPPSVAPFVTVPTTAPSASPSPEPTVACPIASPIAPVSPGSIYLPGPPSSGTYEYRGSATDQLGSQKATYKGNSTWKVTTAPKDQSTGGYDVTVASTIGKATTTRVFRIQTTTVPSNVVEKTAYAAVDKAISLLSGDQTSGLGLGLPPVVLPAERIARYDRPGIYLVSQSSGDSVFKPLAPIPLMQTPLTENDKFLAFGTDGKTVMEFTSTLTKRAAVDACGTKLEAAEVVLSNGLIAGLTPDNKVQQVAFGETLDFGLQFGGLPLRDAGTVTGNVLPGGAAATDTIARTFDFTINSKPKGPKV